MIQTGARARDEIVSDEDDADEESLFHGIQGCPLEDTWTRDRKVPVKVPTRNSLRRTGLLHGLRDP